MEDKENVNTTPVKSVSMAKSKTGKVTPKGGNKSSHPPTSEMVNTAIKELKDRKGSSLQAIKKYIGSMYNVDGEKFAPFIKRYLKSAVTSGAVVQTKGKGASGSFKLSVSKGTESKTKIQRAVKATEPKSSKSPKSPKKSVEKKTTAARKPATAKSPAKKSEATKKAEIAKKPAAKKSPAKTEKPAKPEKKAPSETTKAISKSKKTAKAPAAKTRTPKPKKATSSKAVKAAAKK